MIDILELINKNSNIDKRLLLLADEKYSKEALIEAKHKLIAKYIKQSN